MINILKKNYTIFSMKKNDLLVRISPFHKEVPGWSFHEPNGWKEKTFQQFFQVNCPREKKIWSFHERNGWKIKNLSTISSN
jgi:hypothetical protein